MQPKLITVDPEIHSGTPVFAGTHVLVKTLFDHLEAGDSLDVFLDHFPSVTRDGEPGSGLQFEVFAGLGSGLANCLNPLKGTDGMLGRRPKIDAQGS